MFSFLKKRKETSTLEKKEQQSNVKKKLSESQEKSVASVMSKTGWDRAKTIEEIKDARKRTGVTFKDYNKYDFHKIPLNQQEAKYKEILEKKEKRKAHLEAEKQKAIKAVMEKTGWNYEQTEEKISEARKRTGCAYKEYVTYKFYELDEQVQNELFLIRDSKKIARKFDTNKKFVTMLTNKELTNQCFSAYLKRPWCVNTKISSNEFQRKFANSSRIIYKPLAGNRGRGVEDFTLTDDNIKSVYEILRNLPEGVVEEYVVQHPALSELSPSSVNTLRIVMIASEEKTVTPEGEKVDIPYAALRIGGGHSIIDNFHGGGMVAAVDLESGKLVTDAADMDGNVFPKHPVTGVPIKGFQIPYFVEAIEMVKAAQKETGIEGYLGWDIAITETGPVLIEINLRPGVVLLTTPYIAENKGMKHIMEKYLI